MTRRCAPRSRRPAKTSLEVMSATRHIEHVELPIMGMTCASCAARIERKLNKLDGVTATVNYATERATVEFDPELTPAEDLLGAVNAAGYRAVLPSAEPERGDAHEHHERSDDETAALRQRLVISAGLSL